MSDYHVRTDCRLCSGPIEKVLDLGETALANELKSTREESLRQDRFPLFLSQCKACGHVQLPVVVKPERLFPPTYPYKSGTNPVFRAHLKEFAVTVSGMLPGRNASGGKTRVLEIASNDGTLLCEFESLGVCADGVDPAAPDDNERLGIHRAFFTEDWARDRLRMEGDWYDGTPYQSIVALNVFAHVDDLSDFTAGVAALLPEDGLFVFEVGYLPDVIEKGLFDVCYHEHLSMHHLRPLVPFFRRHGLELVDAHRIDSQGGSVRCFVRKQKPGRRSERCAALLVDEEVLSIERLVRVVNDSGPAGALGKRVRFELGYGKTVAGFGAPAKLTTLLAVLGFRPPVIYDDNPAKVGKFTPGTGIPIVPSSRLLEDNPDYLILFAWNFAEEVIPRLRAQGFKGKIVVPLPEFRVV